MIKIDSLNFEDGRYERKFVIRELDVEGVEQIIKSHPSLFSEIFHERVVNNIYFDSWNMGSYSDNIEGNPQRLKIRIRWYGELFELIKKQVLELKDRTLGGITAPPYGLYLVRVDFPEEFKLPQIANLPFYG